MRAIVIDSLKQVERFDVYSIKDNWMCKNRRKKKIIM